MLAQTGKSAVLFKFQSVGVLKKKKKRSLVSTKHDSSTYRSDCAPLRVNSWQVAACRWDTALWSWGSRCFPGCEGRLPPCTLAPISGQVCSLERAFSAGQGSHRCGRQSHSLRLQDKCNQLWHYFQSYCNISYKQENKGEIWKGQCGNLPCLLIWTGSGALCPVAPSFLGLRITYLFFRLSSW